jgi:fucose permease
MADVRRMNGVAYAGMFVFGVVMALLGAILPLLSERLHIRVDGIGAIFLVMNLAMLVCSLVAGVGIDRFGMKPPLVAGALLVSAAVAGIAYAATFQQLLLSAAALGFGGGALNATTNTLVADLHQDASRKSSALNVLGVFFGFGALLMPFSIGALLATFGLHALLLAAVAVCVAAGLYPLALRFPPPKQKHRLPVAEIPGFLRLPLVWAMGVLLFFQSGIEFTMGGFLTTYFTGVQAATVQQASWLLAAYWGCLIVARIVLSKLVSAVAPLRLILMAAALAATGAALTAAATAMWAASLGALMAGASMAGIFPTLLGVAGARFQRHSGTVFGILFTMALTGGMLLPWLSGQLAARFGLRTVFVLVSGCFVGIAALSRLIARLSR